MALVAEVMAALMLARAVEQGLIDQPPYFALSRIYAVLARGVVATIQEQGSTIVTVAYGPGQPANPAPAFPIPGGGLAGPTLGLDGLDPGRYATAVQAASGFIGPFAGPFFSGVAGIVEHIQQAVTMLDLYPPTGTGTGLLSPGGVLFNEDDCFDTLHDEAVDEGLMVVRLKATPEDPLGHIATPIETITDPTTQAVLGLNDLFSQASILLQAVAASLSAELLFATKAGIVVSGGFFPEPVPPVAGATITSVFV